MHVEMFEIAKNHLESNYNSVVIGGFLSPCNDEYVESKMMMQGVTHIKGIHRAKMISLATQNSTWLAVATYEIKQDRASGINEVMQFVDQILKKTFANDSIQVMYLCGADVVIKCGLMWSRQLLHYDTIGIGRPGEDSTYIKKKMIEGKGFIFLEQDMKDISSTKIRKQMTERLPLDGLTFPEVVQYLKEHSLNRL